MCVDVLKTLVADPLRLAMNEEWTFFQTGDLDTSNGDSEECNKDVTPFKAEAGIVDLANEKEIPKLDEKLHRITEKTEKYQTLMQVTYKEKVKRGETVTGKYPVLRLKKRREDDER